MVEEQNNVEKWFVAAVRMQISAVENKRTLSKNVKTQKLFVV